MSSNRSFQPTIFCFLLLLLLSTQPIHALEIDLAKTNYQANFIAIGRPSALKIKGKGDRSNNPLKGKLIFKDKQVRGTATFHMQAWKTGIALRDQHMKEKYLEVEKFPEARLEILSLALPSAPTQSFTQNQIPLKAKLTLHGVEKTLTSTVNAKSDGNQLSLDFQFEIQTADFDIQTPSYLGIKVTDAVKVSINIQGKLG